jgi:predicted secreted protein
MPETGLPDSIDLHPGESRTLRLPGHGIGGYLWKAEVLSGDVRIETMPTEGADPASIGGSVQAVFRVAATGSGSGRIRFRLAQPWERGETEVVQEVAVRVLD